MISFLNVTVCGKSGDAALIVDATMIKQSPFPTQVQLNQQKCDWEYQKQTVKKSFLSTV